MLRPVGLMRSDRYEQSEELSTAGTHGHRARATKFAEAP